jgi:hypothetical protein
MESVCDDIRQATFPDPVTEMLDEERENDPLTPLNTNKLPFRNPTFLTVTLVIVTVVVDVRRNAEYPQPNHLNSSSSNSTPIRVNIPSLTEMRLN